jgi:hypothetical protein
VSDILAQFGRKIQASNFGERDMRGFRQQIRREELIIQIEEYRDGVVAHVCYGCHEELTTWDDVQEANDFSRLVAHWFRNEMDYLSRHDLSWLKFCEKIDDISLQFAKFGNDWRIAADFFDDPVDVTAEALLETGDDWPFGGEGK